MKSFQIGFNDFNLVFTTAEDNMYREKLSKRPQRKNNTLCNLEKLLRSKPKEQLKQNEEIQKTISGYLRSIANTYPIELDNMNELLKLYDIGTVTYNEFEPVAPLDLHHVEAGYKIINSIMNNDYVSKGVLYHHENYNGVGCLFDKRGEDIPLQARVIKIIDSYLDYLMEKSIKPSSKQDEILNILNKESGKSYDPKLLDRFIEYMNNTK